MRRARLGAARLLGGERGSIVLWLLGLGTMLLMLGGIAVDLGRAFSERRALAAAADAAALAASGAIDEARYRADGSVVLDPETAETRARQALTEQVDTAALRGAEVEVRANEVTVRVTGVVDLTLLRLIRGGEPFTVRVMALARPHLRP